MKKREKENKLKKITVAVVTISLLVIGVTGCGKTLAKSKRADASSLRLNVAVQAVPGFVPLYVMRDEGLLDKALKKYHVDVTFTEFESGPPENESFAAGQQDIGVMGNVPALSGIAAGQKRTLIGIAYNGEQTEATLVGNHSNIKNLKDLKGKKVGLVVGSIAQNLLDKQLNSVGLSSKDVELVNLSPSEQAVALESGEVDAVSTWQPNIVTLQSTRNATILADGTGLFLGENPIVANADYVAEHPEIVKIFLEQYKVAVKKVTSDTDGIAKTYAEQFGMRADEFVKAIDVTEFPVDIAKEDVEDLSGTVDFLYDNAIIEKKFDVAEYVTKIQEK